MSSIVDITMHRVPVTWRTTWVFVEVTLDDGRTGWGEASDAHAVEIAVPRWDELTAAYLGLGLGDALARLATEVTAAGLAMGASRALPADSTLLGGLDQALCDLDAQLAGVPLAAHLGGPTGPSSIPLYANINRGVRERTPREFARVARDAVQAGFAAIKCAPFDFLVGDRRVDTGLRLVEAVREEIGGDVDLMLDAHHFVSHDELRAVRSRVLDLDLRWIEDIAFIDDADSVKRAKDILDIPQAAGEFATRPDQVVTAIESGALDVFMPDVKHSGGDRRAVELGRLAAERGLEVSIHNPTGPVATAHSVAASSAFPTARILECAFGEVPWRMELLTDPSLESSGRARTTDAPGLGVAVDADVLQHHQRRVTEVGVAHPGSLGLDSLR
ncbi:galactonate dehydratase [Knoellia remsis]|uniref:Galactonate dehydratase n=1 Tax=Knoellia remsis TaxID=407159 RepID=A0A2T0V169_9MICO|nr:mandelate racemase/muconate lactonizing enzyme family protein [Knoellia remsis]PRY63847.1 galactonate dehydratase [Knoellia remsis]